jgi:hypothetical protein
MFLVKSVDWEYESEYRVLAIDKGAGIHSIDQTMISRVVAGAKMPLENYLELSDLVSNLSRNEGCNPKLVQAEMLASKYKLNIEL